MDDTSVGMNSRISAISLAGEPLLYPRIDAMVGLLRKKNFTTFIVSNGTLPEILNHMESLPTQLYVTLPPPRESLYKQLHRPAIKRAYARIMETLDQLETLECRTCLRITLIKGLNDDDIEGYTRLIDRANPDFVPFVRVYCPTCGSVHCPIYNSNHVPVRYHRCQDCGRTFKSVEVNYRAR